VSIRECGSTVFETGERGLLSNKLMMWQLFTALRYVVLTHVLSTIYNIYFDIHTLIILSYYNKTVQMEYS